MEAKEALDGPTLWEDACITDDEAIIVYANLDRSARGVMLVCHGVHHGLTHGWTGKREPLHAIDPVIGDLGPQVLSIEQVDRLVHLLYDRTAHDVLVEDLWPLKEADLHGTSRDEGLRVPREEQGGRIGQVTVPHELQVRDELARPLEGGLVRYAPPPARTVHEAAHRTLVKVIERKAGRRSTVPALPLPS